MMQDPTVDSVAIIDGIIKDWVDYSTISTYINCPFKCLLQYTLSIRSEKTALELIFGGAIHFGLETAYQWWAKNPEAGFLDLRAVAFEAFLAYWEAFANEHLQRDEEHIFPRSPGNARALLGSYFKTHYDTDKQLTLVGTEVPIEFLFQAPPVLDMPETKLKYVGRIDRLMMDHKQRLLAYEVKTSSVFGPTILFSYEQSFQTDGYMRFINSFGGFTHSEAPQLIYDVLNVQKTSTDCHRHTIQKLSYQIDSSFQELSNWISAYYRELVMLKHILATNPDALHDKRMNLPIFNRAKGTACTEYMRVCPYSDLCRARPNPLTYLMSKPQGFVFRPWDPRAHEALVANTLQHITQKFGGPNHG